MITKAYSIMADIWEGIKYAMIDMGLYPVFVFWFTYLVITKGC